MGAELILYGFFKKLVIADRAVILITTITGEFENFRGTYVLLAALTYALQLYADFSGGIDISRGVAEMLGIMLPENFRRPYFARNISDYWHRWHITLGAWLRNYLFYPIAMSKMFQTLGKKTKKVFGKQIGKVLPTSIASLITFIVIGIWHGANWKYVAFGFWNGAIIMISTLLEPYFDTWLNYLKIKRDNFFFILFQMVRTFFIVLVGYYFDIAANLSGAVSMMVSSVMDFHFADLLNRKIMAGFGLNKMDYFVILFGAVVIFIASFASEKTGRSARELLGDMPYLIQCMVLLAGIACVALMGIYGPGYNPAEFVYMQF